MVSIKLPNTLLFLSSFLLISIGLSVGANVPQYIYHNCTNATTYTPNGIYQINLRSLLSSLSSNASSESHNTTAGEGSSSPVYGSFFCRGDVDTTACRDCVSFAVKDIVKRCPVQKETMIWYNECQLRYSNRSFFGTVYELPVVYVPSTASFNETDPYPFNLLAGSIQVAAFKAAKGGPGDKKFATNELDVNGFSRMYTLAQCTPDLNAVNCGRCLSDAIARLPECCSGKLGGRVLFPSCNVRYDVYPFYNQNATAPPPAATQPPSKVIVISVVVPVVVATLLLVVGCSVLRVRARKKYNTLVTQDIVKDLTKDVDSLQFSFESIETATNNFSDYNMLGKGGFGDVYKGVLLNGQEIAVKRLSKNSRQGATEFKNEVVLVAKLQHKNLVRLLGFCLEGNEKILVYEYVPNKSLDYFLFDPKKQSQLNWSIRCNIIEGIARGIQYLHEDSRLKVIHRDLKASNILLDKNMSPKVSDFGMARMFGEDQTQGNTMRIVGTYGYMAPEYAMEGLYSVKSDVFSFGVLLLEILSGSKNSSFRIGDCAAGLVAYAWQLWNEERVLDLMDPWLKDSCYHNEFMRYLHIALLCVQEDANLRPTMSSVVSTLKSEAPTLSHPERHAFISTRSYSHQEIIGTTNSLSVNNGMTITDLVPR
ncbi:cysteine-rich receptor-like protein kinase 10 isoform X2 [Humulus lupulus]|uniref:cysteine-rich receptor-like protein kinase 10 isoform X2 n=1 Tax=Humulus lupulus TaxID=3486 RepID=UPI002B40355E|nr:cysteine-rich receptor-like protein kinase 10 isoform X2 [Humulus lupulus]